MTAPIRSMADVPLEGEMIAVVTTLDGAVDAFRLMKDRLGLTNEFLENVYGFAKGHPDKVLGRSEQKRLGYDTFRLFCEVFAVEFRVYVNPEQVKRMEAIWEQRERPKYRPDAKPGRISKKIMEAAAPIVFQQSGKLGAIKRMEMLRPEHRSAIARKAAKSRWSKARRKQPSALVR